LQETRRLGSGPIARASAISLVIRVAGLALSFAQAVLTARLLGASGYGTVALVMAIVSVAATLCQFGLVELAIREIAALVAANDAPRLRAFIRFAITMVVALSALSAAVIAALSPIRALVPEHYRETLALGGLLVLPGGIIGLLRGLAQGFGRIALAQVPSELVRPAVLVLTMAVAALIDYRFSPDAYVEATGVAALLTAAIAAVWLWRVEQPWLSGPAGPSEARKYTAASLPFAGLALVAILQGEVNTLLLGWLSGPRETGLFQPIVRLAPVLTLAVQVTGMRYAPRVAEFWERGEIGRIRSVTRTFTWTTTLATFAAAIAIAAAGPLLMRVFGPEFRAAAPLLWYIAAAQVFSTACGPVFMLLLMARRSQAALVAQTIALVVNLAIGLVLIPNYGARGAVLGMAAGLIVGNLIMIGFVRGKYKFDPSILGIFFQTK
jgi:O-antigen/teichoic acid export membrane protein